MRVSSLPLRECESAGGRVEASGNVNVALVIAVVEIGIGMPDEGVNGG